MAKQTNLGRAAIVLAIVGATLGSALDMIHTYFGATSYADPFLFRAPIWVPLMFGSAYIFGLAWPYFDNTVRPSMWKVIFGLLFYISAYWISVAPWLCSFRAITIGAIFGAAWWLCDRTFKGLCLSATAAIVGPTLESTMVSAGIFVHHEVTLFGVPCWLPTLYLVAGVGIGSLAKWIGLGSSETSSFAATHL